jgi:hypothetical protein
MKFVLCFAAPLALCAQQFDVAAFDRARVMKAADSYLNDKPVTVTASHSPRGRPARLLFRRRLLVARPENSRRPVRPARRHDEPR